jgi:ubiquinone/menaquinone biosynthesis C-methylase UbiE/uncharacterized protein YbaR (Trm112 family)
MDNSFLAHLVCPFCKDALELDSNSTGDVLTCSKCTQKYQVVNGIPRFVSQQYSNSFGFEWQAFAKTQLDSYTGTNISYNRFVECTGIKPESLEGKRVLEVGCGAGRFLEVLSNYNITLFGVDMSGAVDIAHDNLDNCNNVFIAQADLFHLPFRIEHFDLVYSIGVLHHTPNTLKAFNSIVPYVKKRGQIAVYVYGKSQNIFKRIYENLTTWVLLRKIFPYFSHGFSLKILKFYVKFALKLTNLLFVGRILQRILPVWDYSKLYPQLSKELIYEWALLDTFDAFTPRFQRRHSWQEVYKWFEEANLKDIKQNNAFVSYRAKK